MFELLVIEQFFEPFNFFCMITNLIYVDKTDLALNNQQWLILFTQPLRSGRIWHKVNF